MGNKRKLPPKPAQSVQPPLKQQQQQQSQFDDEEAEYEFAHQEFKEQPQEEEEVEDEEEQEEEVEDEEEEYQEYEEEEPNDHIQNAYDQTANSPSTSSPNYDDEEEPIQKLLEPLGKDEIARLLCDAATKHRDVGDWIRAAADVDPAHRKIFVHGLGWDTTAETLSAAFRQYGEIEDCKAVTDKITGKSKGYGFILFRTRGGARNALRQPQKKIGNRTTACQLASVGPVQNNAVATAPTTPGVPEYTQRKIYVSNVGAELDLQRLLAFFSLFGEIEEGPLGLDKVTGKPKGFCFFVYKSVESAKRALVEPHKNFEGHVLHCQRANDGSKQQRLVMQGNSERNVATAQLQRNENHGFVGGMAAPGHLMAQGRPVFGGVADRQWQLLTLAVMGVMVARGIWVQRLLGDMGIK
ncbi:hypothetical protein VNO77_34648 [Canavalia gladiata]|uniref:RRM domain-containing protein n=1 Tax=Canavalia gladiata TaxID=3824 RepID=A0AAN9PXD5_CANGL